MMVTTVAAKLLGIALIAAPVALITSRVTADGHGERLEPMVRLDQERLVHAPRAGLGSGDP